MKHRLSKTVTLLALSVLSAFAGTAMVTVAGSSALAVPAPSAPSTTAASREAVEKSGVLRASITCSPSGTTPRGWTCTSPPLGTRPAVR